jgi:PLP dependent protein
MTTVPFSLLTAMLGPESNPALTDNDQEFPDPQLYADIRDRITQIKQSLPEQVKLIAVSKSVSADLIRQAYAVGIRDFGENRVQEAVAKQQQLADLPDLSWHLIGHLQTNKARIALETFDWIHSVDSLKLAQRLQSLAVEFITPPKLLLQVKALPDPNKYGWSIAELLDDLSQLAQCDRLAIQGLMTILPLGLTDAEQLTAFEQIAQLAEAIRQQTNIPMTQLSMGMSDDYLLAIQAGASMVRLGRILFSQNVDPEQLFVKKI